MLIFTNYSEGNIWLYNIWQEMINIKAVVLVVVMRQVIMYYKMHIIVTVKEDKSGPNEKSKYELYVMRRGCNCTSGASVAFVYKNRLAVLSGDSIEIHLKYI